MSPKSITEQSGGHKKSLHKREITGEETFILNVGREELVEKHRIYPNYAIPAWVIKITPPYITAPHSQFQSAMHLSP